MPTPQQMKLAKEIRRYIDQCGELPSTDALVEQFKIRRPTALSILSRARKRRQGTATASRPRTVGADTPIENRAEATEQLPYNVLLDRYLDLRRRYAILKELL